jgi:hypothetical protein
MTFQQYPFKGGIPSGNTAGRPSNPVIGDTYYNGQLEILEIYNGTNWVGISAPPVAPTIATPTDVGTSNAYTSGGSLEVVFTPGVGGGTPSGYVAYTTVGSFTGTSTSTTITLTGLTPGTSYTVYGAAQNSYGISSYTANAAAVTPTTRPQAPTITNATTSGSDVTVTWTLGATGGKNLSAITITPYLNGTTAQTSRTAVTTSSTSYTFTGATALTEDSSYTFKVKTTNANGDSPESSASNSVTIDNFLSAEYLVVAGGASGNDGGGGAGGYRASTLTTTPKNGFTVTVGAGGAGTDSSGGNNGSNSIFSSISATGGGKGGEYTGGCSATGFSSGGSGGGAGWRNCSTAETVGGAGNAGSYSPVEGYAGGAGGNNNVSYTSGGGGGAGAVGGDAMVTNVGTQYSGNGGDGVQNSILGTNYYWAGGGGGGAQGSSRVGGNGGRGGGGGGAGYGCPAGTGDNGNALNNGANGVGNTTTGVDGGSAGANTGGGGGGRGITVRNSGNGGSGIVVLKYLTSTVPSKTIGAGLTYTESTSGSYTILRFTQGTGTVTLS